MSKHKIVEYQMLREKYKTMKYKAKDCVPKSLKRKLIFALDDGSKEEEAIPIRYMTDEYIHEDQSYKPMEIKHCLKPYKDPFIFSNREKNV